MAHFENLKYSLLVFSSSSNLLFLKSEMYVFVNVIDGKTSVIFEDLKGFLKTYLPKSFENPLSASN